MQFKKVNQQNGFFRTGVYSQHILASFFPATYYFVEGVTAIQFLCICQEGYLFDESGELITAYMLLCDIDNEIYEQKGIKIISLLVLPFEFAIMIRGMLFMFGL